MVMKLKEVYDIQDLWMKLNVAPAKNNANKLNFV